MALTDNLIAYWKLDESSGNASDSSGNGHTLTNNSISYGASKINNGAIFNGSNTFTLSTITPITINLWLNPSVIASKTFFMSGGGSQTIQGNGSGNLEIWDGASHNTSVVITTGSYHMYSLVWTGSGYNVYKDFVYQEFVSCSQISIDTFGRDIGNGMTGYMDEVGFWSIALSSSDLVTLGNGGTGLQYPFTTINNGAFFAFM